MHKGHKIAIALVAIALVIVIGLIAVINMNAEPAKVEATAQPTAEPTVAPAATEAPTPDAAPDSQAQNDEAQGNGEMYEGALAGMSEEEIGKLAMAEEQSSHGDAEADAQGDGEIPSADESVAGVAD